MKFYKETKIGIIVTLIIAGFIWGLNFLKGRNFFSTTKEFYAVYSNISGLKKSSPVSANGYTIGRVSAIEFAKGNVNKIIVEISVERQFSIPKNSIIEINNSDLMGSKAVNIVLGDSPIPANDKDTLNSKVEEDLSSIVARQVLPLKEKSEHLIVSLDSVMSAVKYTLDKKTQNDIRKGIANMSDVLSVISEQRDKISTILENLESVSLNLKKNNQSINHIVGNVSAMSDSLAASHLKQAIKQASVALEQTNELLVKVNKGQGTLGKVVSNDSLYRSAMSTIRSLDSLINDLNKHPKRYVHFSVFGGKDASKK